jgi:hypothetical protein
VFSSLSEFDRFKGRKVRAADDLHVGPRRLPGYGEEIASTPLLVQRLNVITPARFQMNGNRFLFRLLPPILKGAAPFARMTDQPLILRPFIRA